MMMWLLDLVIAVVAAGILGCVGNRIVNGESAKKTDSQLMIEEAHAAKLATESQKVLQEARKGT